MSTLDPVAVGIGVEAMDTASFEAFGQVLLSDVLGIDFEPTGGVQDGGQDGFIRQRKGRSTSFIQISKEKDVRAKVRKTIVRLRETGREPASLLLLTSEEFPTRDAFEDSIQKDTGVEVRIHDRSWLISKVTSDSKLSELFAERASSALHSATKLLGSVIQTHTLAERISILAYMDAHAKSAPLETDLLTIAVDATIYRALEGTDPALDEFRTREQITKFVEESVPAIKNRPALDIGVRLERLSTKSNNPRIRRYTQQDKYCLPYDVRNELSEENMAVRRLEAAFIESIRRRAREGLRGGDVLEHDLITSAVMNAIVSTFEKQGMNLAASFDAERQFEEVATYGFIVEQISGQIGDNSRREGLIECAAQVCREVMYSGLPEEREYILQLFKLFSVEFVLRGDDRVASHFQNLVKNLKLYVGTDVLIRALSESCVAAASRATQNALMLLSKAGARLFLTEQVLSEVYTHVIAENKEFENEYQPWFAHATPEVGRNSDRILIRAFFYDYFEPERHEIKVRAWRNYLDQIGQANWFDNRDHLDPFAAFLMRKFDLEWVSERETEAGLRAQDISRFADAVSERRDQFAGRSRGSVLARNDAVIALFISSVREKNGERVSKNVYGFSSWWLTEEFQVVEVARKLNIPSSFAMHPQFLMNIFAVTPALRDVASAAREFFPTNFGLRITDRVSSEKLREFLRDANKAAKQEPAIAEARIRELSNKLKSQRFSDAGRVPLAVLASWGNPGTGATISPNARPRRRIRGQEL